MGVNLGLDVFFKENLGSGESINRAAKVTGIHEDGAVSLVIFAPNNVYNVEYATQGEEPGQFNLV